MLMLDAWHHALVGLEMHDVATPQSATATLQYSSTSTREQNTYVLSTCVWLTFSISLLFLCFCVSVHASDEEDWRTYY
jgi:hypothetical protein